MVGIHCQDVSVSFTKSVNEAEVPVLKDLNLSVRSGELLTIFGPNGCGKSTLLNSVLGHIKLSEGSITFSKENPRLSYVFQDYRSALMPWLNAFDNVCFPLAAIGIDRDEIQLRFNQFVKELPIRIDWQAYSYQLSGGQAQLVSILRSLIIEPEVLLLDEPFSALDYQTNLYMLRWLQQISLNHKITMIFVSHQIDEAIFLGDKVVLLTPAPARVAEEVAINLARPRALSVMGSEEFRYNKDHILSRFLEMLEANG